MGYHRKKIPKGTLGEFSKIREEFLELEDAVDQESPLLVLCELADIYGAIQFYLEKNHPSIRMEDIKYFSDLSRKAFREGRR